MRSVRLLLLLLAPLALVAASCGGEPGVGVATGEVEPTPIGLEAPTSDPDGVEGEDLCAGFATGDGVEYGGLTCTWTANGTWELPAEYTTSDWWITVQGLGGTGGVGVPTDQAAGGTAGQAQATFSGDELDGETLYLYVGQDGDATEDAVDADVPYGGTGASASMVTTTEVDSSWSAGTTAADVDAVVVAGGGGGGGAVTDGSSTTASGGAGGVVVATTETLFGTGQAGEAGSDALGGQPPDYDGDAYDGDEHVSGGFTASDLGSLCYGGGEVSLGGGQSDGASSDPPWVNDSTTLTLEDNAMEGGCADVGGGGGGGGHAGGGGGATSWVNTGTSTGAGGGGGSSWALGGTGDPPSAAESWFDLDATSSTAAVTIWADAGSVSSTQTMYVVSGDSYLTTGSGNEDGSPEGVVSLDLTFDLTADPYTATLSGEPLFYLYTVDDSSNGTTYSQYASLTSKTDSTLTVDRGAGVVGGSFELVEGPSDQLASLGTANLSGTYDLIAGTASIDVTYSGSVVGHLELVSAAAAIEVTRSGEGHISSDPDGVSCGSKFCTAVFPDDETVTLTATADTGHTFSGWGGACSGSDTTCTLSDLSSASTTDVTATFESSSS